MLIIMAGQLHIIFIIRRSAIISRIMHYQKLNKIHRRIFFIMRLKMGN